MTIGTVPAQLSAWSAATNLLDVVQTVLVNEYGVELPEIVAVMPGGLIAYDGPQLTVNLVSITAGIPGVTKTQGDHPSLLQQFYEFNVMLLRSTPVVGDNGTSAIPDVTDLTANAQALLADAPALWATIVTIHANYLLVEPGVPFAYGPLHALGPDGGLAGCGLSVFMLADS